MTLAGLDGWLYVYLKKKNNKRILLCFSLSLFVMCNAAKTTTTTAHNCGGRNARDDHRLVRL